MKADLSTIELFIRVSGLVMLAVNIAVAALTLRVLPLLKRRSARPIYLGLVILFNLPLLGMIVIGHHLFAQLPAVLLSAWIYPGLAWHVTHLVWGLLLLASAPLRAVWRGGRWLARRRRRRDRPPAQKAAAGATATGPDGLTSRRRLLKNAAVAVPAVTFAGTLGSVVTAGGSPVIRRLDIRSGSFGGDLDGLRLAHISDLHVGSFIRLRDVDDIVRRIAALQPELVVFTGDLVDLQHLLEPTLSRFSRLSPPLGFFCCLGNHEYFFPLDEVQRAFAHSRCRLLVDSWDTIGRGGSRLVVAGLDYAFERAVFGLPVTSHEQHVDRLLDQAPPAGVPLLTLAHNPNAFEALAARGAALVLAGHTHGGQIVPFRSEAGSSSLVQRRFPRFYGHYTEGSSQLYVTSGVGHWLPLRVNCPREIALLTLRRS